MRDDNHDITRFPLTWPNGWVRTLRKHRQAARFRQGIVSREPVDRRMARRRLAEELRLLGADRVVVSSDVPTKALLEYEPDDPGVAVYFSLNGKQYCLPCDRWSRVADNIVAIANHIDAQRSQKRWGVGSVEQAFAGYQALPPKADSNDWPLVLGIAPSASLAQAESAFKRLAKTAHPDHGGSHDAMSRLTAAREAARRARPANS